MNTQMRLLQNCWLQQLQEQLLQLQQLQQQHKCWSCSLCWMRSNATRRVRLLCSWFAPICVGLLLVVLLLRLQQQLLQLLLLAVEARRMRAEGLP